jgi:hypothetical protein
MYSLVLYMTALKYGHICLVLFLTTLEYGYICLVLFLTTLEYGHICLDCLQDKCIHTPV